MLFLIPYQVDVPYDRRPVTNWLIVAAIVVVFILQIQLPTHRREKPPPRGQDAEQIHRGGEVRQNPFKPYIQYGWRIKGLLGHMWLHGGWFHVIGNLIFLWLFGNAICSKIGNSVYLPVYVLLGVTAAVFHEIFNGNPAVGASGAINGIVGMYLVFFPENFISCAFVFFFPLFVKPYAKTFSVSGIWVILLWFALDIWRLMRGGGQVAYCAHIGGFITGFGLAILMLVFKTMTVEEYEKSLLQMIGVQKRPKRCADYRRDVSYRERDFIDSQAEEARPRVTVEPIPLLESESVKQDVPAAEPDSGTSRRHEAEPVIPDGAGPDAPLEKAKVQTPEDKLEDFFTEPLKKVRKEFVLMTCSCGKRFRVPLRFSARTGICPECKAKVKIPESDVIFMRCVCGKRFKVPAVLAGRYGRCPNCKRRLKIPERSAE